MTRRHPRLISIACLIAPVPAAAQVLPDRTDPALVTRSLPANNREAAPATPTAPVTIRTAPDARVDLKAEQVVARAVVVDAQDGSELAGFTQATAAFVGRSLSHDDLLALARAVANAARARDLVFATAAIPAQPLTNGVLHVAFDEGRVDAVRSLGAANPAADAILARLITHRGVSRAELERAILLVGDLPGVQIKSTRYVRDNGFGILLVTLASDRLMTYASVDNRGTRAIGPIRGVGLASLRGRSGDEIGLVVAGTPTEPSEFQFVSGRYAAPISAMGGIASASVFYGYTHAGAGLGALDLTGESYGVTAGYSVPLQRSRRQSLWFDIDFRTLRSTQDIRGLRFRDDRIAGLTGTVRDMSTVGGGVLHMSVQGSWGLPLAGVTRAGDPLASRVDGDARYVLGFAQADWVRPIAGPMSVALASAAQIASRPLLASAQVSLGGPAFARGYDYSERTGDEGVMGSAELRLDLHQLARSISRAQLYAFGDGGMVDMLRDGAGGGSLASGGGGLRVGSGAFDGGVEMAVPFTGPRFDAGNRSARFSGQVSMHF